MIEPFRELTGNSGKAWIGTEKSCFAVEVPNQILSGDDSEKQVEDEFRALETEFCLAEYNQDLDRCFLKFITYRFLHCLTIFNRVTNSQYILVSFERIPSTKVTKNLKSSTLLGCPDAGIEKYIGISVGASGQILWTTHIQKN